MERTIVGLVEAARRIGGADVDDLVGQFESDVIDIANERTNGAFADVMDVERADALLDSPGWGYPSDVEGLMDDFESDVEDASGGRMFQTSTYEDTRRERV